jgi:hypothetical protein
MFSVTHELKVLAVTVPGEVGGGAGAPDKRMRLRFAGVCRVCGLQLPAGSWAMYERPTKSVRCEVCPTLARAPTVEQAVAVPDPSGREGIPSDDSVDVPLEQAAADVAGASARREFERRHAAREARIRAKHPRLGGLMLALSDDPQSTRAWGIGAEGEERLGRALDGLGGPVRALHDRRIRGTRANIDHLVVCPGGVLVIDAKRYQGRPHLRVDGGILRERTEKLMVGSRDCSRLVDGVLKQVTLVRDALADESIPVRGFLCFVAADWPLFGGSFTTREVSVLWPKKLTGLIGEAGNLGETIITATHERLAVAFPRA